MDLSTLIDQRFLVPAMAAIAGAVVTFIVAKLRAKTVVFRYSIRTERMAVSADDAVFGSVRVSWRDNPVRNLYLVSVEVENPSTRDFERVPLKVYTGGDTVLLTEQTAVVGTPYIVRWSPEFELSLAVAPGQTATQAQFDRYNSSREYLVPVFNRGQLLELNLLVTRLDDLQPAVFLSMQYPGARLALQNRSHFLMGVPVQASLPRGLGVAVAVVILSSLFIRQVWLACLIGVSVGLFAQFIGALVFKGDRWVRRVIAG